MLNTCRGDKIVFMGNSGYSHEARRTRDLLVVGESYRMAFPEEADCFSSIYLTGFKETFKLSHFVSTEEYKNILLAREYRKKESQNHDNSKH